MGVFNTLFIEQTCPNCKNSIQKSIQFKFGDVWLFDYYLGDKIKWKGNDYGKPNLRRVKVLGTGGDCPICGYYSFHDNYDIIIEEDIIKGAISIENTGDYQDEDYVVLD